MRTIRVCGGDDVAIGTARRFDVGGHRLCVVRLAAPDGGDEWHVIGDRCSHADYSLAEGDVWAEEREIECPKHGSTFSLVSGDAQTLPATQPVPVYAVSVRGGDVLVTLPAPADEQP